MDWLKKHTDTVIVLATLFGGFLWMNGKFNAIEKDITIIKTVLIMKGILPTELASNTEVEK
jgi:hypothetical protein